MKISVLIATRNRCDDLFKTLTAYKKQTYPDVEIVVVDNGSTDGTGEMIRTHFSDTIFFRLPDNIIHQALNLGVELSSGDIIWRSDDDSFPESPDAFKNIIDIFKKFPHISIIGSAIHAISDDFRQVADWHPKALSTEKMPEDGFPAHAFVGAGAAIRREVFKSVGGFWNTFYFEEMDFTARAIAAGFKARFFPSLITLHYNSKGERVRADRWVSASINRVRYEFRYFPFWRLVGRFWVFFGFQLLFGILLRVPISAFFEAMFGMIAMAFGTFRKERNVLPAGVLQQLTFGETVWAPFIRITKEMLDRVLKRVFKKK